MTRCSRFTPNRIETISQPPRRQSARQQNSNYRRRKFPRRRLPNFPEKLKPSPAIPSQTSPVAQTPLKMGFSPASAGDCRIEAHLHRHRHPRRHRSAGIRIPPSPIRNLPSRHAAAQRPAPPRRRHRQTLRAAGIRPRTGAAGPARGARTDFVRADDEPHRVRTPPRRRKNCCCRKPSSCRRATPSFCASSSPC